MLIRAFLCQLNVCSFSPDPAIWFLCAIWLRNSKWKTIYGLFEVVDFSFWKHFLLLSAYQVNIDGARSNNPFFFLTNSLINHSAFYTFLINFTSSISFLHLLYLFSCFQWRHGTSLITKNLYSACSLNISERLNSWRKSSSFRMNTETI